MKRGLDLLGASAALVVLGPIALAVALLIRVVDGTPVLYRHRRLGRGGRPFTVLKFRTMRPASDDERSPDHDTGRLTHLGRFLRSASLDELPTLLNVLRGDMSLVGPRPLPASYLARYTDDHARRLEVRPGITGLAVINGRNTLHWHDRLNLDVWYVDHRSLRLDLRILARTPALVLRRAGIDHALGITMTEYLGPS